MHFEYLPGLMVSPATLGVVRRIVRLRVRPGAFVEQEASTNSYPGFTSSASVTVLVASALAGFTGRWRCRPCPLSATAGRWPVVEPAEATRSRRGWWTPWR